MNDFRSNTSTATTATDKGSSSRYERLLQLLASPPADPEEWERLLQNDGFRPTEPVDESLWTGPLPPSPTMPAPKKPWLK
jgi:hypothetical protein